MRGESLLMTQSGHGRTNGTTVVLESEDQIRLCDKGGATRLAQALDACTMKKWLINMSDMVRTHLVIA